MVELKESTQIALPVAQVWALIRDPLTVASCINGATLQATDVPDKYTGTMRVKFGPTVISFLGEARVSYDNAARSCTVEGRGHDKRGASNAAATITIALAGEETCDLNVQGGFQLTGPLEGFARSGGVHIARVMLKDFADNIVKLAQDNPAAVTTAEPGSAHATASPPPHTEEAPRPVARAGADVLDAGAVTRRATRDGMSRVIQNFKQWLKGLFQQRTN